METTPEFGTREWFDGIEEIPFGTFTKVMRHTCGEIINVSFVDGAMTFHGRFDRECKEEPITTCRLCGCELDFDWLSEPYVVEPMNYRMMLTTKSRMNCSNCWGHGWIIVDVKVEDEDGNTQEMHRVLCANCLEETRGYVSTYYIGKARIKDYERYGLVRNTIPDVLGIERKEVKRSESVILQELGFGL